MNFWEQIEFDFKISELCINHFIWQLGYEALMGCGPMKRYSSEEFKQRRCKYLRNGR